MGTPHRIIETPVYHFDQLSDSAKDNARNWWKELEYADPTWAPERRQSLEAFCKFFPIEAKNWEYDAHSWSIDSRMTGGTEESRELSGVRLYALIQNHYSHLLSEAKVYEKGTKKRTSRILRTQRDCPFTGYCADEALLDPIREYLENPDMDLEWQQLLRNCLESWGKDCSEDMAWMISDEHVDETIIANEYEFDETGGQV